MFLVPAKPAFRRRISVHRRRIFMGGWPLSASVSAHRSAVGGFIRRRRHDGAVDEVFRGLIRAGRAAGMLIRGSLLLDRIHAAGSTCLIGPRRFAGHPGASASGSMEPRVPSSMIAPLIGRAHRHTDNGGSRAACGRPDFDQPLSCSLRQRFYYQMLHCTRKSRSVLTGISADAFCGAPARPWGFTVFAW